METVLLLCPIDTDYGINCCCCRWYLFWLPLSLAPFLLSMSLSLAIVDTSLVV